MVSRLLPPALILLFVSGLKFSTLILLLSYSLTLLPSYSCRLTQVDLLLLLLLPLLYAPVASDDCRHWPLLLLLLFCSSPCVCPFHHLLHCPFLTLIYSFLCCCRHPLSSRLVSASIALPRHYPYILLLLPPVPARPFSASARERRHDGRHCLRSFQDASERGVSCLCLFHSSCALVVLT